MTQISRPQPGRNTTYPDAGPYSGDQWAELLMISHVGEETGVTTAGRYTRGPYASFLNRLEVTDDGAIVTIDTGAGWVNGHLLIVGADDATDVDITPTAPAALDRVDRVVMVQNNTNAVYNTNLDVPAEYAAGVPAYSTRLALLQGVEGAGVPRAMVQDINYWMVELAQYEIDILGAITGMTDYRDYVDAMPKWYLIPAQAGYRSVAPIHFAAFDQKGLEISENVSTTVEFFSVVPKDFISSLTAMPVLTEPNPSGGANDVPGTFTAWYHECSELYTAHTITTGNIAVTMPGIALRSVCATDWQLALTNATVDDILHVEFYSVRGGVDDTYTENIYLVGVLVEYLGYRR